MHVIRNTLMLLAMAVALTACNDKDKEKKDISCDKSGTIADGFTITCNKQIISYDLGGGDLSPKIRSERI